MSCCDSWMAERIGGLKGFESLSISACLLLCVCVCVCLSLSLSLNLSIDQSICLPIYLSLLSDHVSICLSYSFIQLSNCLFVESYLLIYPSICLSVRLSMHRPVCIYLSACLSVCLSTGLHVFSCLSISQSDWTIYLHTYASI